MLAFEIVLIVVFLISIAIAFAMFLWAAREDGRDQKRIQERLNDFTKKPDVRR